MNRRDIGYIKCSKITISGEKEKSSHTDKSDENSIRSGFLSADTEADTHRKYVSCHMNGEILTKDECSRKHS